MQHIIRRCSHCGREYIYCTYGNKDNRTLDFCGECGTAVKEALSKIPQDRFVGSFHEIESLDNDTAVKYNLLLEKKKLEKKEGKEDESQLPLLEIRLNKSGCIPKGTNFIYFTIDGIDYRIYWDDETPNEKSLERYDEYDNVKKEYTGKPWKSYRKDSLEILNGTGRRIEENLVPVRQMEPPCGLLNFLDFKDKKF